MICLRQPHSKIAKSPLFKNSKWHLWEYKISGISAINRILGINGILGMLETSGISRISGIKGKYFLKGKLKIPPNIFKNYSKSFPCRVTAKCEQN